MDAMTKDDSMEIGMLAAELSRSVTYISQETDPVVAISKVIMDWAHADDLGRRAIYAQWRGA